MVSSSAVLRTLEGEWANVRIASVPLCAPTDRNIQNSAHETPQRDAPARLFPRCSHKIAHVLQQPCPIKTAPDTRLSQCMSHCCMYCFLLCSICYPVCTQGLVHIEHGKVSHKDLCPRGDWPLCGMGTQNTDLSLHFYIVPCNVLDTTRLVKGIAWQCAEKSMKVDLDCMTCFYWLQWNFHVLTNLGYHPCLCTSMGGQKANKGMMKQQRSGSQVGYHDCNNLSCCNVFCCCGQ